MSAKLSAIAKARPRVGNRFASRPVLPPPDRRHETHTMPSIAAMMRTGDYPTRADAKEARDLEARMYREMGGYTVKFDPEPLWSKKGHVYFLETVGSGLIKIGFSKNAPKRLADLRNMSGASVKLRALLPGSMGVERRLHVRFAKLRAHGEWFTSTPRLQRFIEHVQAKYPLPDWAKTDEGS